MALNECTEFRISISVEKSKMPIHRNTFLGVIIDSLSIELQIPAQKLSWLNRIAETWAHKRFAQLSHACIQGNKTGKPLLIEVS